MFDISQNGDFLRVREEWCADASPDYATFVASFRPRDPSLSTVF